jgi:ATP-dependent DNA helicase RecG
VRLYSSVLGAGVRAAWAARDDAALTPSRDPQLTTPRGEALRVLHYLFARSEAIRLLGAG